MSPPCEITARVNITYVWFWNSWVTRCRPTWVPNETFSLYSLQLSLILLYMTPAWRP